MLRLPEGPHLLTGPGYPKEEYFTYDKIYLTELEENIFRRAQTLVFPFRESKIGLSSVTILCWRELKERAAYIFILRPTTSPKKPGETEKQGPSHFPGCRKQSLCLIVNTVGTHLGMISPVRLIADPDGAVVVSADESQECLLLLSTDKFDW